MYIFFFVTLEDSREKGWNSGSFKYAFKLALVHLNMTLVHLNERNSLLLKWVFYVFGIDSSLLSVKDIFSFAMT